MTSLADSFARRRGGDLTSTSGWVSTLEEWFDPKRLSDAYVPTGFIPPNKTHGAVKDHEFGLKMSEEDKADLIAFLRTHDEPLNLKGR
jgi:hypothetical protein